MSRQAEFAKGAQDRRQGDGDPNGPLGGFGAPSPYPPGEQFRAQLNQSSPRPGATEAVSQITQSVRDRPDFNPAPVPPPQPPRDGGGFWDTLGNYARSALSVGTQGGSELVGQVPGAVQNALSDRTLKTYQAGGGTNNQRTAVGPLGDLPPTARVAQEATESLPRRLEQGGEWLADASGVTTLGDTTLAALSDPRGAAENVWGAANVLATNPTKAWRAGKVIVPAAARYFRENPSELAKLGVGAVMTAGTGLAVNAAIGGTINAVKGAAAADRLAQAAQVGEEAVQAGRVATEGVEVGSNVTRAAGVAEDATSVARTAGTAVESAAKPSIASRALQGADKAIDLSDRTLGRVIGAKEDLRNFAFNLPRRALGMEQKDLRLGFWDRQMERLGDRVAGGVGADSSDSALRQTISARISPPRREMPELPEGASEKLRNRVENTWRRSAREEVVGNHHPVDTFHDVQRDVSFAAHPLQSIENWAFGGGDDGDDGDLSEYNYLTPGQARGYTRSSRRPASQSVAATPSDADTQGFYQRGPGTSRATAYRGMSVGGGTEGPPSSIGPSAGYSPGRGWQSANSSMYRDEQEPAYG